MCLLHAAAASAFPNQNARGWLRRENRNSGVARGGNHEREAYPPKLGVRVGAAAVEAHEPSSGVAFGGNGFVGSLKRGTHHGS